MPSPGMCRCVTLVRTDPSEESIASIIRVTRIGELETTFSNNYHPYTSVLRLLVTANVVPSSPFFVALMMDTATLTRRRHSSGLVCCLMP
jgi:hypothetical protein